MFYTMLLLINVPRRPFINLRYDAIFCVVGWKENSKFALGFSRENPAPSATKWRKFFFSFLSLHSQHNPITSLPPASFPFLFLFFFFLVCSKVWGLIR
jgi:hypothetical protein